MTEKKYVGRGGWRGGGRPRKKEEDKTKFERVTITCRPETAKKIREQAKKEEKSISSLILNKLDFLKESR